VQVVGESVEFRDLGQETIGLSQLEFQYVANHLAGFFNFGHSDGAVQLLTLSTGDDKTSVPKLRDVLGQVCLGDPELLLKIATGALAFADKIEELDTAGMGNSLA
jgi:hypothetical protein